MAVIPSFPEPQHTPGIATFQAICWCPFTLWQPHDEKLSVTEALLSGCIVNLWERVGVYPFLRLTWHLCFVHTASHRTHVMRCVLHQTQCQLGQRENPSTDCHSWWQLHDQINCKQPECPAWDSPPGALVLCHRCPKLKQEGRSHRNRRHKSRLKEDPGHFQCYFFSLTLQGRAPWNELHDPILSL